MNEEELKVLNNLVSGYFDLAEINAIEHKPMYMKDYVDQLDAILLSGNRKLLAGYGKVSHDQAMKKAKAEYRKYQKNALSPVEQSYMETIKDVGENAKKRVRKEAEIESKYLVGYAMTCCVFDRVVIIGNPPRGNYIFPPSLLSTQQMSRW